MSQSNIVWSCNAMAATPTPATLRDDLIDARAGRVIFKEGKSGTVNLICPVTTVSEKFAEFTVRSLHLTYRDGDGNLPNSEAVVSAALRRIRQSDGHVETVNNGNVSSNDPNAPASGPQGWKTHQSATSGNTIGAGLDFENFYYYVQITMKREGSAPLAVQGVFLTN